MSVLKLTYCQLIKIILSQIGGNPLQQVYSQLSQGQPQIIARSGIIPQGLAEVKNLIDTITNLINAAQNTANDFSDTVERIGGQIFQNPIGSAIDGTITVIDARLATITTRIAGIDDASITTPRAGFADIAADRTDLVNEQTALGANKTALQTLLLNTNKLSGIGGQSGATAAGGCSLQDLLGSGCSPNNDVPDVDLKQLIESLKSEQLILAIRQRISNATGYSDYVTALASFKSTIDGFNTNFVNQINRATIRNAVTAQLTQIVFNLLSGCGNTVYDLTLKSNVKNIISVYAAAIEAQNDTGNAYYDGAGNVVTIVDTTIAPTLSNIVIR